MSIVNAADIRAWAVDNGWPEVAGRNCLLPKGIRDAFWAAHPDAEHPVAPEVIQYEAPVEVDAEIVDDEDDAPAEDVPAVEDDGDWFVTTGPGYGDIDQEAADFLYAVHEHAKGRIVTWLREQPACACTQALIDGIEAMA